MQISCQKTGHKELQCSKKERKNAVEKTKKNR